MIVRNRSDCVVMLQVIFKWSIIAFPANYIKRTEFILGFEHLPDVFIDYLKLKKELLSTAIFYLHTMQRGIKNPQDLLAR